MRYFDEVFEAEKIPNTKNLIVLGYSQGVSVALRYVAKRRIKCSQIVLLSGGIPKELVADDFSFLNTKTKISMIFGDNDEYLDEDRILQEKNRAFELFGHLDLNIIPFEGTHEVKKELVHKLV
jgi:predicted esterase